MSILIKGMEMPKSCEKCIYSGWSNFYQIYVCNAVRKDEPVLFDRKQVKSTAIVRGGRADNCPLIPVPEHGRLKDYDQIMNEYNEWFSKAESREYEDMFYALYRAISDSRTIIPGR